MMSIILGAVLVMLILYDIVRTTLTTQGEGPVAAGVMGAFRAFGYAAMQRGRRTAANTGAMAILVLGIVWLGALWAGWVFIFIGIPEALAHSGGPVLIDHYDRIYFVGFTLSSLGIGDLYPDNSAAQMATVMASVTGLLVITLIVTYAISVVSGVVARRALAHRIYLTGEERGDFVGKFNDLDGFAAWLADIKENLVSCTEQRLAYPILDNFVAKEEGFSIGIQLAKLGLVCVRESQQDGLSVQSRRELKELLMVLYRYTALTGITDEEMEARLRNLGKRNGWSGA